MIHRQIEKLQKMVNNLLGLCSESGADAVLDEQLSTLEDTKNERLGIMLLKMQDGALEQRYVLRLEKWLMCDKKALRYYVDFQSLTAMLSMHFNPDRFTGNMIGEQIFVSQ
jgi:hypothetical protein